MSYSSSFGLSIYSKSEQEIYTWTNTYALTVNGEKVTTGITTGPAVKMSTAAVP